MKKAPGILVILVAMVSCSRDNQSALNRIQFHDDFTIPMKDARYYFSKSSSMRRTILFDKIGSNGIILYKGKILMESYVLGYWDSGESIYILKCEMTNKDKDGLFGSPDFSQTNFFIIMTSNEEIIGPIAKDDFLNRIPTNIMYTEPRMSFLRNNK